jgi:hypothetical protein
MRALRQPALHAASIAPRKVCELLGGSREGTLARLNRKGIPVVTLQLSAGAFTFTAWVPGILILMLLGTWPRGSLTCLSHE